LASRLGVVALVAALAVVAFFSFAFPLWRNKINSYGGEPADPFRIAGNFYFVGSADTSVFLVTGPQGHVLLDSGRQGLAPMVIASMAKLGFNIKDVKALINSDPGNDRAGALAALQEASGAELWASEPSARVIAGDGDDPDYSLLLRGLIRGGLVNYPKARVDHRLKDGDAVRVGPVVLTAHITGGYSRGCTTWTFPVRDGDRTLNVVSACPLHVPDGAAAASRYPERPADLERILEVMRKLPVDIWVTSSNRVWGRLRKFEAGQTMKNPADAFIDRDGYRDFLDAGERDLRAQ